MSTSVSPAIAFGTAIERVNAGDSAAAESVCREALASHPDEVNLVALLGAVLLKMKRLPEAERALRRATQLAPGFAKPHEDLGLALYELRRPLEAVEALQRATQLDAELDLAFFVLGKALATLGRMTEAAAALTRSFELAPQRRDLATASGLHDAGRLAEAERTCRDMLRANPDQPDALRLLGIIAFRAGRHEQAEAILRRAIALAPDFSGALLDLGRMLKEQERYAEAIECCARAIAIEPDNAAAHFHLASVLAPAALTYRALESYQRALQINPRHASALLGLGHMLKTVGRQEEAIAAYRRCMELRPDQGEVHWSLANLKTYRFTDPDIASMESRLAKGGLDLQSEVNFLFALAKAREDRADYDRAWQDYLRGSALRRTQERYDPVQTEVLTRGITRTFTAELLRSRKGVGNPDPAPIFIMGLPRSGSTLIEQMLASHSQVEGTGELPYLGRVAQSLARNRADGVAFPEAVPELDPAMFAALGERYLSLAQLHRTRGTPHFIDKMPNNFPYTGFLHLILPNARIIDARRHPLDACLGCYRQLFARGQPFTYDLTDIGEYFLQYQQLMDFWHEVLPGRVLTVQYEDIVTDTGPQLRRILDFCGLPWEDGCLRYYETDRPVRTASSEQVRQPIYTTSIGHWRHYRKHLAELIEILEPVLPRYRQFEGGDFRSSGGT